VTEVAALVRWRALTLEITESAIVAPAVEWRVLD
jgi:hypothetical protein